METEYELRGFYRPNFFSLFINGEFDEDFTVPSKQDLGTFVHEYIHYLQNITTIFGLQNSNFYFDFLNEVLRHIVEKDNITIPLIDIIHSEKVRRGQIRFRLCNGTKDAPNSEYDDVKVKIVNNTEDDVSAENVLIELYLKGKIVNTIIFGNYCVKESMAYLYQQFYDDEVNPSLIPYRTTEILCDAINPELLDDKRKLIALCVLALNSQNSGLALYHLLHKTKAENHLSGIELYKQYLTELTIKNNQGETKTIKEFLLDSIQRFSQVLEATLHTELKHFKKLLENIKLTAENDILPLIEILYDEDTDNIEKLNKIKNFYGIPHIQTVEGHNFYQADQESGEPAMEFVELIGQRIVLDRLLGINRTQLGDMCPLRIQCEHEPDLVDEYCYDTQWLRENPCPFKIISDYWGLKDKINVDNN